MTTMSYNLWEIKARSLSYKQIYILCGLFYYKLMVGNTNCYIICGDPCKCIVYDLISSEKTKDPQAYLAPQPLAERKHPQVL